MGLGILTLSLLMRSITYTFNLTVLPSVMPIDDVNKYLQKLGMGILFMTIKTSWVFILVFRLCHISEKIYSTVENNILFIRLTRFLLNQLLYFC